MIEVKPDAPKLMLTFQPSCGPDSVEMLLSEQLFRFCGKAFCIRDVVRISDFAYYSDTRRHRASAQEVDFICSLDFAPGLKEVVIWPKRMILVANGPWVSLSFMAKGVAKVLGQAYGCEVKADISAL